MSDLLRQALAIAETGRAVFPVGVDKKPRTARGFHDASTDPAVIRKWNWNDGGMIGATIPAGEIVVDVDPRNGGADTMRVLGDVDKHLPLTRHVKTGGGGDHFYLRVPACELRGSLGPGVDIKRAGKGYVIIPPSKGYAYVKGGAPAVAPQWLLDELIVVERTGEGHEAAAFKGFDFETGTAYGMKALEGELTELSEAPQGSRNDVLNRAAFAVAQLVAGGELNEDPAIQTLISVALGIGLDTAECKATIASAWKAGTDNPRQAPPRDPVGGLTEFVNTNVQKVGTGTAIVDTSKTPGVKEIAPVMDEDNYWTDWEIDEPEPPFYISGILPKHAYVLVYGATEASKSMAWVGLLCQGSHQGYRSSVYSLENPPHTDRDRLRRWAPNRKNFRLTNEALDFNDPRHFAALVAREKAWQTDVIMIDTYSHAFHTRSEDGNAKAIDFAVRVRHLMAEVGCSVVVIDHTGYAQQDEPRDASAKRQQVDVAILMKKRGVWTLGAPARFSMHNHKAARFANPFHLDGEIVDVKGTENRALELNWTGEEVPAWVPA